MKYITLETIKFNLAVDITGKNPEDVTREDVEKVSDETAISWIELCEELTGKLPEEAVVTGGKLPERSCG